MRIDDTDPHELPEAIERRRRRRVVLAVVAVVLTPMLVAAGFVVARATQDDAEPPSASDTAAPTDPPTTEPEEQVVPFQPQGPNEFPNWGSDFVGDKLELLAERITDDGIAIRVQKLDWGAIGPIGVGGMIESGDVAVAVATTAVADGPSRSAVEPAPPFDNGWAPAGWCNPSSGYRVTMTRKNSVGTAQGQWYDEVRDDAMVTLFSSGFAEGLPFRVVVVQVSPDVTAASVQFVGGGADSAPAKNGLVLLGVMGNGPARFTLTLTVSGLERAMQSNELGTQGDAGWTEACTPPPPRLPDPGEQPADPKAAEEQVRFVFDVLFDRTIDPDDKPDDLVDDPTGVDEAIATVNSGPLGEVAASATYVMGDLVFTSPVEAWFKYSINTSNGVFADRYGIARYLDGKWKIVRAVVCQDLALAGTQCSPPATEIRPPVGD